MYSTRGGGRKEEQNKSVLYCRGTSYRGIGLKNKTRFILLPRSGEGAHIDEHALVHRFDDVLRSSSPGSSTQFSQ